MSKACLKHDELFTNVIALVREYLLQREDKSTKVSRMGVCVCVCVCVCVGGGGGGGGA